MKRLMTGLVVALAALVAGSAAAETFITVASTTSTQNSGLYDHILPRFTARTGITVRVIAVGTGQAVRMARNGDADVLFVHHKRSEEKFVADGFGVGRFDVMYNDFVLLGPVNETGADPAGVGGEKDIAKALSKIAEAKAVFASRGDDSGTHKKELSLWKAAGADPKAASGSWYRETGAGMGATLNTASAMNAYVLTDRATWLKFRNRGALKTLVEGDERLFNQYGIILVNPKKHPHVKAKEAQAFIDWVLGAEGQAAIGAYRIKGRQAFFPNAPKERS
ncbi:MAG: sulfate transporter [Rhodospirillaceae bacterium]|jgi:tungstate transport system substrate-binding protein|nr:sulfate transporter [Rhodospirillaceae bacterium]|tara:strand:- start:5812 stop:6648 length:837 start_codon:yes stop_codon:yes gene_type:complete